MTISIIIPTYNEQAYLDQTVAGVRALEGDFELIVVDGQSTDGTAAVAARAGVRCLPGSRGRANQMNQGAAMARGAVLVFLHADSRLPADAYMSIADALRDPQVVGGCFRLRFDQDDPALRLYGFFTRFSFRLFHYGDEAFFVRAATFRELGGFKPYPIMEDLDFWLRLRRRGSVVILPTAVVTSARRFVRRGPVRQQLLSVGLVLLFLLGVSPTRLKRFYPDVR